MATIEQLSAALIKADAAGNSSDAKAFADEIRKMKTAPKDESIMSSIGQGIGNLAAGAVRGAGSIGATILAPYDMAKDAINGKGLSLESNRDRRNAIDGGLQEIGAQPDSLLYKGGKLAGEIAGTAGSGGAIANLAGRSGMVAPTLLKAIQSGGMTTGVAADGVKAGAVNMLTRAAGGSINGLVSAGMVDPKEALIGAAIGGALPATTAAFGAAAKYARNALTKGGISPEVSALAGRAKELGIDIPADRLIDSKPMNALASSLNYMPFSGRAGTEAKMGEQLNTAASRLIGQDTPNINKALRAASDDLGGKFDSVLKNNSVKVDKQFIDDITGVYNTAQKELGSDGLKPIASQIDELLAKGGAGEIDGQAAYNIKRTLDRIGRGNRPESFHALELKGKLMDALDRSLGPDGARAFAETRQQYGNMLSLEKLAKNGAEGEISIARLANMKNINNQPLQELADIASQFVKAREGQHGAMQRALVGGSAAVMGGLPGLAVGVAAGRAGNSLLNSNMLKSALLNQAPVSASENKLIQSFYRSSPVLGASR